LYGKDYISDMKKTLQQINELVRRGIIKQYAIAGGLAQFYYIEPSVTYDLDLIVNFGNEESKLNPLSGIYEWAKINNYELIDEHIKIEGIPVQFLPAYNDLVKEALLNAKKITLFEVETFILGAEYLMAILLQTGRAKDSERLTQFLETAEFSKTIFEELIARFSLNDQYEKFKNRYER
jgi:hypothetical protein